MDEIKISLHYVEYNGSNIIGFYRAPHNYVLVLFSCRLPVYIIQNGASSEYKLELSILGWKWFDRDTIDSILDAGLLVRERMRGPVHDKE